MRTSHKGQTESCCFSHPLVRDASDKRSCWNLRSCGDTKDYLITNVATALLSLQDSDAQVEGATAMIHVLKNDASGHAKKCKNCLRK